MKLKFLFSVMSFLLMSVMLFGQKSRSLLISDDFSDGLNSGAKAYTAIGAIARLSVENKGTIDTYKGEPGRALSLKAALSKMKNFNKTGVTTKMYQIGVNSVSLNKLTLGFDLCSNKIIPVRVFIKSYSVTGKFIGSRTALVTPPMAGSYYRFTLDMDKTQAYKGEFDPKAPYIQFSFEITQNKTDIDLEHAIDPVINLDNLTYTKPAYYVSVNGDDHADGWSEKTAFANIQKAADVAIPGDVVMIMQGTYANKTKADISQTPAAIINDTAWRPWWVTETGSTCSISNHGTAAAWIVFRSYPGQQATLYNEGGWAEVMIGNGAAFIELRDLILKGNVDMKNLEAAKTDGRINEIEGVRYTGSPYFNNNGVMVDGRSAKTPADCPHHLRFTGNTVHHNGGGGIAVIAADYVTLVGNIVYDNAHFTRYGASGISFLNTPNFDDTPDYKMFVIANTTYLNGCYVPWARYRKNGEGSYEQDPLSDGNGIIIDVNIRQDPNLTHKGRTLVSNNLSYGNGGGGIVVTTARAVDIVNNTLYKNVQTPDLAKKGWGDIFVGGPKPGSSDIRIVNNIAVNALNPLAIHTTVKTVVDNNVFWGNNVSSGDLSNKNNLNVDPLLVNPSVDPRTANFHLLKTSKAIKAGTAVFDFVPSVNFEGRLRNTIEKPNAGAY